MVAPFGRVYTDAQRDAIDEAATDRNMRGTAIARAAERGELAEGLAPFTVPMSTAADMARKARRRRAGRMSSPLAHRPPADALEILRRRLVALVDHELRRHEARVRGPLDLERIERMTRIIAKIGAIPGEPGAATTENRRGPRPAGERDRDGTSMASAILRAHEGRAIAPETPAREEGREAPLAGDDD